MVTVASRLLPVFRVAGWVAVFALFAAPTAAAQSGARVTVTDPSLEETRAWIEREMPALLNTYTVKQGVEQLGERTTRVSETARDVRFRDCTLTFSSHSQLSSNYRSSLLSRDNSMVFIWEYAIPLRDVDVRSIGVAEDAYTAPGETWTVRPTRIRLVARDRASFPFVIRTIEAPSRSPGDTLGRVAGAELPVQDAESAERVIRALRHAAQLCGAQRSPF